MGKNEIWDEKSAVADRLKNIRKKLDLTQENMAEIFDISTVAYKKLENGQNNITVKGLRRLNEKLNVSSDYILFGTHDKLDDTWKNILNCSQIDIVFAACNVLHRNSGRDIFPRQIAG